MRYAVFTEDGLDQVCDTSADAAAHVDDLRDLVFDVRQFEADDETIFDLGHDAIRDGKSWAVAKRLMVAAVADAAAQAAASAAAAVVVADASSASGLAALLPDERRIISALLSDAKGSGLLVSVHDGEEWAVPLTSDYAAARRAFGATGETLLRFASGAADALVLGSVWLIHGNGVDVIADYSDNPAMSDLLRRSLSIADALASA